MGRPQIEWKRFAKVLWKTREQCGLSLRELADDLQVSHGTLSRAENGKPTNAATFIALCHFADCDPTAFLK